MFNRKNIYKTKSKETENTLFLYNSNNDADFGEYFADLTVSTGDSCCDSHALFRPFAYDVLSTLFDNTPTVATVFYDEKTIKEKRLFQRMRITTEFEVGGYPDEIIRYINKNNVKCNYINCIFQERHLGNTHNRKALRIFNENTDAAYVHNVFESNDIEKGSVHLNLSIESWEPGITASDMNIEENILAENTLLCISLDEWNTRMTFIINKNIYSIEKLISILTKISEKHGKKLEVQL